MLKRGKGLEAKKPPKLLVDQDAVAENYRRLVNSRPYRHAMRFVFCIVLLVVCYSLFVAFNFRFWAHTSSWRPWDPEVFTIVLSSCDLTVQAGSTPDFRIEGMAGYIHYRATGQGKVRVAHVTNPHGCNQFPYMDCARACRVVVSIPKGRPPKRLWIYQMLDDATDHATIRINGVTLQDLTIRGPGGNWWDNAGPSLELEMANSEVLGDLEITMDGGHATLKQCKLHGKVDIRSKKEIELLDIPLDAPVALNWRQPNNAVCLIGGDGQLALPDAKGAFQKCEAGYYKSQFQEFYDTTGDRFLDFQEFRARLDDIPYCCGQKCPHATWCDGLLYKVFPFGNSNSSDASYAGRSEILSASAVWDNLKELKLAMLVPYCFREVQFTYPMANVRVPQGHPKAVPRNLDRPVVEPRVWNPCVRHSDCFTGFCNRSICAGNPNVAYTLVYTWSACDKVCGGGQRVQMAKCIGSDGLLYPETLCRDPIRATLQVETCNTRICKHPQTAPVFVAFGPDEDLRSDWARCTARLQMPEDAEVLQLHLGTSTALLNKVGEIQREDCNNTDSICTLSFSAKLPKYVDRVYAVGVNSDGRGPRAGNLLDDRIGQAIDRTWKLQSEAGNVRVHIRSTAGPVWTPMESAISQQIAVPDKKPVATYQQQLRIYHDDAKRLMKEVGPTFGDLTSTQHGLVVIDVVGSVGIPATRWIYLTRGVFLALDPAHLAFFSAGLLTPVVKNYRVRFDFLSCASSYTTEDLQNYSEPAVQVRLEQMYIQIERSLKSDGWAVDQQVRGYLVLVDRDHRLKPEQPYIWQFEKGSDGTAKMSRHSNGPLDAMMDTAVMLSLVVGVLFAIFSTGLFSVFARRALDVHNRNKWMAQRRLASKLGDKYDSERPARYSGNPFEMPILLISALFVAPVRSRLINSLWRFTQQKCEISLLRGGLNRMHDQAKKIVQIPWQTKVGQQTDHSQADPDATGEVESAPHEEIKVRDISEDSRADHNARVHDLKADQGDAARHDMEADQDAEFTAAERSELEKRESCKWDQSKHKFVYMLDFRQQYEEYCIEQDLRPYTSQSDIVRALITWYDLRVCSARHWRLSGVRWNSNPRPLTADEKEHPLIMFCKTHLEVTHNARHHYVDMSSRRMPSGELSEGLRPRYARFCQAQGLTFRRQDFDPLNQDSPLHVYALTSGVRFSELTVLRIPGLIFAEGVAPIGMGMVILGDLLQVFCNLAFLIGPVIIMSAYALWAQEVYAKSMATLDPLVWSDILGKWDPFIDYANEDNKQMLALNRALGVCSLFYITLVLAYVLLDYTGIDNLGTRAFKRLFGIFLACAVSTFLAWLGTVGAWAMLATILDPERFLAYGSAVIVLITVVLSVWTELCAAAKLARGKVEGAVHTRMQSSLRAIEKQCRHEVHEKAVQSLDLRLRIDANKAEKNDEATRPTTPHTQTKFDNYHANRTVITPSAIFDLLDDDGNQLLTFEEFRRLFANVDDTMSEAQIEQLFAYCDVDGSGTITQTELEEAWDFMAAKIVDQEMASLGLTTVDIVIGLVLVVSTLVALFAFIFLALQGWHSEKAFDSAVQTVLVAASGKVVTKFRRLTKGEKTDMDRQCEEIMSEGLASSEEKGG